MSRQLIIGLAGLLFLVFLLVVYSNHFDNGFYFDDSHTISNNEAIRSLDNLSSFFLDASTFSALPANRAYRPIVTTLNAISYSFNDGLDPESFHWHLFFWYVVQLVLMYFMIRKILDLTLKHEWNDYFALAATVFYAFHTANAETVNYLISISDSFSTLCIVATLLVFQSEKARKYYLYLIPLILALYTKQTGLMAVPILMIYVYLIEEKGVFNDPLKEQKIKLFNVFKQTWPAIFVGINILLLNQLLFTPSSTVSLNASASKFQYFYTQFFIVTHYLRNFILPNALSADPDFGLVPSFLDLRVMFGLTVIAILLAMAFWSMKKKETAPIAFGILWFFIALIPTSSFIPLYQIANDHRTFFPYVGLVISVVTYVRYLFGRYDILKTKYLIPILGAFTLLIAAHAYGVYQRNEVWNTSESLWHDVAIKSPKNGRGLMNYGISQMQKGNYKVADEYFSKAKELSPNYSYLFINIAILKNAMGQFDQVEPNFQSALKADPTNPECYYYYASWLNKEDRKKEAYHLLKKGLTISANHGYMKTLYQQLSVIDGIENYSPASNPSAPKNNDENAMITLSLEYYNQGQFEKCIEVCRKIIASNPNNAIAYNNICSSYNNLKRWEEAMEACTRALQIDPNFTRARNNLNISIENYHKTSN